MLIKKIVIASVLKPVNDARMYEKIGRTLAESGKYEVHIIGTEATLPTYPSIRFHPIKKFERISFSRVFSYWNIAKTVYQLKPEVLIVNTHELLILSVSSRILFGTKILYDIQENYFRNIWYQRNFPAIIKHLLAIIVRVKEWICMPFISIKLLAETKYLEELPFAGKNSIEILNKYNTVKSISTERVSNLENEMRFLYSGTVSEVYGIHYAIYFHQEINKYSKSTLTIIGHCPSNELFILLNDIAARDRSIKLIISKHPIDHELIVEHYTLADFALTPYLPNKSTENCIPVKFYEYIAFRLPIIIPLHNPLWISFLADYKASYPLDYQNFMPQETIKNLKERHFFNSELLFNIYWESEGTKLLSILDKLFIFKSPYS